MMIQSKNVWHLLVLVLLGVELLIHPVLADDTGENTEIKKVENNVCSNVCMNIVNKNFVKMQIEKLAKSVAEVQVLIECIN
jgi:hypothetical protein